MRDRDKAKQSTAMSHSGNFARCGVKTKGRNGTILPIFNYNSFLPLCTRRFIILALLARNLNDFIFAPFMSKIVSRRHVRCDGI